MPDKLCVLSPEFPKSPLYTVVVVQGQTMAHNGAKITKDADVHDCMYEWKNVIFIFATHYSPLKWGRGEDKKRKAKLGS